MDRVAPIHAILKIARPSEVCEKMLDKTIADSFPASDPLSSDPAPSVDPFGRPMPALASDNWHW